MRLKVGLVKKYPELKQYMKWGYASSKKEMGLQRIT
jgi:hypothetical protein